VVKAYSSRNVTDSILRASPDVLTTLRSRIMDYVVRAEITAYGIHRP